MTFVDSPEEAATGVQFVQESAPERVELKQRLLAAASAAAGPDVVFCSSTSGLRPSLLQAEMEHPERFAVGHPFNPVYLLPLVELLRRRSDQRRRPSSGPPTIYRASACTRCVLRREIDGFLADRLLEALWREALWLVNDDDATVEEIDDAISYGAGLRWAIMGTFLTYRLGGGEAGMAHFMEQFGPTLSLPWTRLVDVPSLTPELIAKIVSQSDTQARRPFGRGARAPTATTAWSRCSRRCARRDAGAGETLAAWERGLLDVIPGAGADARGRRGVGRRRAVGAAGGVRRARSRPAGSTTTATSPRAATWSCSPTPPTHCCATSGSTPHTSARAAATTRSRRTSPTSGSSTPAIACRRSRRCSAGTRSACTSSTRSSAWARTSRSRWASTCSCTSTRAPAEPRRSATACADGSPRWPRHTRRCPRPERSGRRIAL